MTIPSRFISRLPASWASRLALPLIAAPMFRVSGPDLVIAACKAGVIGSFPTANCRSIDMLDAWLQRMYDELDPVVDAPFCPNLIMRRDTLQQELDCLLRHRVELVITSVGSPEAVVAPLHDIGCTVFADVASVRHARKAAEAGADGLILLTAGAGGQTGWANGFAFARAVRQFFDGPLVLAGGVSDGASLLAAQVLGCDLSYMGTKFIAADESMALDSYKNMLLGSELDDILLSRASPALKPICSSPPSRPAGWTPRICQRTSPRSGPTPCMAAKAAKSSAGVISGPPAFGVRRAAARICTQLGRPTAHRIRRCQHRHAASAGWSSIIMKTLSPNPWASSPPSSRAACTL